MSGAVRQLATALASVITLGASAVGVAAPAWAGDIVTYEVVSDSVAVANVEWQDVSGRRSAQAVALPWRMDAPVRTVHGPPPDGSQVRADWRPNAWPTRWVTVRISYRGKVICQNTLDVGDAACYGITRRIT